MATSCKPRPTALKAVIKADTDITQFRNVYCRHYAGCIDVVVKKGWASFTCTRCPFYASEQTPRAADQAFNQPADRGTMPA